MIEPEHVTYRTPALLVDREADAMLRAYGEVFGRMRHHAFVEIHVRKHRTADVKRDAQPLFGVTARQFNGVRIDLDQASRGWKGTLRFRVQSLKDAIERTEEAIEAKQRQADNARASGKDKKADWRAHGARMKKWRLDLLKGRLRRAEAEAKREVPKVCFGGAELLRSGSRADMRRWHEKRTTRICLVGSRGEAFGNSNVQWDGSTLRVQLPACLSDPEWFPGKTYERVEDDPEAARDGQPSVAAQVDEALRGTQDAQVEPDASASAEPAKRKRKAKNPDVRWIEIQGVTFAHGQEALLRAVEDRRAVQWLLFLDDDRVWQVRATIMNEVHDLVTRDVMCGVAAIDLNVDHVALVVIDASGNATERHSFPFPEAGTPAGVALAMMGETCRLIRELCEERKIPLAREILDFAKKRAALREFGKAHARRLSSWGYSRFFSLLDAMMIRAGVEVIPVDPAYTSVTGRKKYARWLAMSRHHAAALVIGRRAQDRGERYVTVSGTRLDGPDRNLSRIDARRWRKVKEMPREAFGTVNAVARTVGTAAVGRELSALVEPPARDGAVRGGPHRVIPPRRTIDAKTGCEHVQVGQPLVRRRSEKRQTKTRNA